MTLMNYFTDVSTRLTAFMFGVLIAICTGIVLLRHGVMLVANVVPPLLAIAIGALCAVFKIVHVAPALGCGVFLGAIIVWTPITLANMLFPIIFVPVLFIYAALVPTGALIFYKFLIRYSENR